MKCSECGQYDALSWSKHGFCLRCWLKSSEPPPGGVRPLMDDPELEERMHQDGPVPEDDPEFYDAEKQWPEFEDDQDDEE